MDNWPQDPTIGQAHCDGETGTIYQWNGHEWKEVEFERVDEPRTAQDADNALLVRALMEGHVAYTERLGAIQRVVHMANEEVFHVKLIGGNYLLTVSIRAALRRALGEA